MKVNFSTKQTPVQPSQTKPYINKKRYIKLLFSTLLAFLFLSIIYIFFLSKSEFSSLTQNAREQRNTIKEKDEEIAHYKDELDKYQNTWVEIGKCSSEKTNVSIESYPKNYSCSIRISDGDIKLTRNDGVELIFTDMWASDGFPTNCPKLITHISFRDANQDIKLCLDQQSQWIVSDRIIYDKKIYDSTIQKQGGFDVVTLKGFSKEPTKTDIDELKTIFNSIVITK